MFKQQRTKFLRTGIRVLTQELRMALCIFDKKSSKSNALKEIIEKRSVNKKTLTLSALRNTAAFWLAGHC